MTPITTLRAQLPCPSCGVIASRVVALRSTASATEVIESRRRPRSTSSELVGRVSECSGCWARRADRVGAARARLRASGELGRLGEGREDAWLGVPLSRAEVAYECAFASALLKSGDGPPPPAAPELSRLRLTEEVEADAPTELPVSA